MDDGGVVAMAAQVAVVLVLAVAGWALLAVWWVARGWLLMQARRGRRRSRRGRGAAGRVGPR